MKIYTPLNKGMVLCIVLLAAISSIPSSSSTTIGNYRLIGESETLYVGGSGGNNYTSIQAALNDSNDCDTIFVYSNPDPYYEHIIIDTSIDLIGENKETTSIDGEEIGDVITVLADSVTIIGFTIQNGGDGVMADAGIEIHSNYNSINGNIIANNGWFGLYLNASSNNNIENNLVYSNGMEGVFLNGSTDNIIHNNEMFYNFHCAIVTRDSRYNKIIDNEMYENHATVSLWSGSLYNEIAYNSMHNHEWSGMGIWEGSDNNYVHHNHFYDNLLFGITIKGAEGNVVERNIISGSEKGITLSFCTSTIIKQNNFIDNDIHAYFDNSSRNRWMRNYWGDQVKIRPKIIRGETSLPWNPSRTIHWFNLDMFSARNPYEL